MMGEECQFHTVTNAEADEAVAFCEKAIPHNELIGRVLRNFYGRLQLLENENVSLKEELAQLKQKWKARG
jgi:hypothetical protein